MSQSPKSDQLASGVHARTGGSRRKIVFAAVLLLLAGAGWYWHYLSSYHPVLQLDLADPILEPRAQGFLVAGDRVPYSFYDWHGRLLWQLPRGRRRQYIRAGTAFMEKSHLYALSPDGQYLSLIDGAAWQNQSMLQTWRNGKPYRRMSIPLGLILKMEQMNDGSIYLSGKRQSDAPTVLLIRATRIQAAAPGWILKDIAEDGAVAVAGYSAGMTAFGSWRGMPMSCYKVTVVGNRIKFSILNWRVGCSLHNKGVVLFSNGMMEKGNRITPLLPGNVLALSPARKYAALYNYDGKVYVISPETGDTWTVDLPPGQYQFAGYDPALGFNYTWKAGRVFLSDNGDYMVISGTRDAFQQMRRAFASFPKVARLIPNGYMCPDVQIYRRPDHLVARFSKLPIRGYANWFYPWVPSPDGRALVSVGSSAKGESHDSHCILLRKWR